MATPVLETRDLSIRFGGHLAVDRVSATFAAGTLTAIVGPNGAGKTTYFNLISGQLPATAGSVLLAGRDITRLRAAARARLGLGRAFQLTNLFPNLTRARKRAPCRTGKRRRWRQYRCALDRRTDWIEKADAFLAAANLRDKRDLIAVTLPHGDKRKLEVAIMMALEPQVFMFDEPTAGMSVGDVPVILDLIKTLESRGQQDHSAGRTQNGGGAQSRRPHRRAA